jgi:hypothetical protein
VAAHTTWPVIAGELQEGEITISDSLERLCPDLLHPNHLQFKAMALYINRVSPTKNHIEAVL